MRSYTEENYLKLIYKLSSTRKGITTNALAELTQTKPSSVSDMFKKLSDKQLIVYKKYQGVRLTEDGEKIALRIIRNHRLWEVFLVEKLRFNWDEVHEMAEELEHIAYPLLIKRLDEFLGYPAFDPHGDPIPTEAGYMEHPHTVALSELEPAMTGVIAGVRESSAAFLQYLDKLGVRIGTKCRVLECISFDGSIEVMIDEKRKLIISRQAAQNISVRTSIN